MKLDTIVKELRRDLLKAKAFGLGCGGIRCAHVEALLDHIEALRKALEAVVDATRAYLPPDGIDPQECLNRILLATDNSSINPLIEQMERDNGR